MKYEVPEINISKFSEENVVTVSSIEVAKTEVEQAIGGNGNSIIATKVTLDDWVEIAQ